MGLETSDPAVRPLVVVSGLRPVHCSPQSNRGDTSDWAPRGVNGARKLTP